MVSSFYVNKSKRFIFLQKINVLFIVALVVSTKTTFWRTFIFYTYLKSSKHIGGDNMGFGGYGGGCGYGGYGYGGGGCGAGGGFALIIVLFILLIIIGASCFGGFVGGC